MDKELPKFVLARINEEKRIIDFVKVHQVCGDDVVYGSCHLPLYETAEDAQVALKDAKSYFSCHPDTTVWHLDELHLAFARLISGGKEE